MASRRKTFRKTLATLISGYTITQVRDGTEKIDVVARAAASERADLGHIADLTIVSRNGVPVTLGQIAKISYEHEEPILWRRNRDMSITVRSDVVDGVQPPDVTSEIWPKLADIRDKLASGLPHRNWRSGGGIRQGQCLVGRAISPSWPLVMLTLLMIQLQSFARLVLVFLTAPLGIIGASLGLNLFHKPFGFVALLGLIALAGMIMRNAVILVDQIESDVAGGRSSPAGHRRSDGAPGAARCLDGAGCDPGDDPPLRIRLLGADGHHHHGWTVRSYVPDLVGPAGAVCRLVPEVS